MKKNKRRSLSLNKETLRDLDSNTVGRVAGGVSDIGTNCAGFCITCNPGNCLATDGCGGDSYFCATESDGCDPGTGSRILCFPTHTGC